MDVINPQPLQPAPKPPAAPTPPPVATPTPTPTPTPSTPVSSPMVTQPESGGSGKLIAGLVLVLLLLGLGAFGYTRGWFASILGNGKAPTMQEFIAMQKNLKSAHAEQNFSFSIDPKSSTSTPINMDELWEDKNASGALATQSITGEILGGISPDLKINIDSTLDYVQKPGDVLQVDLKGSTKGSVQTTGMTFNASMDYVMKNDEAEKMYVSMKEFPSFVDVSPVLGKWVAIDLQNLMSNSDDARTQVLEKNKVDPKEDIKTMQATTMKESDVLLAKLAEKEAIRFSSITDDVTNGISTWKMQMAIDGGKVLTTYQEVIAQRETLLPLKGKGEYVLLSDDAKKALEEVTKEAKAMMFMQTVVQGSSLTFWVDKKARQVVKEDLRIPVAFATKKYPKLDGKEFVLRTTTVTSQHNQPLTILAPNDAISVKQAMRLVQGTTPEEGLLEDQQQIITDIQDVLEAYKKDKGSYPATLNELVGYQFNRGFSFDFSGMGQDGKGDPNAKEWSVKQIPNDLYTNQPFVYQTTGKTYTLKYQIKLAPATGSSIWGAPQVVEGTNTANEQNASAEYEAKSALDSDADGLKDTFEQMIGTDPLKVDTDGDTYPDGQEYNAGYDPLSSSSNKRTINSDF